MFTQLSALLKDCSSVNIIMAMNKNGTLSVTVIPKPKTTGEEAAALGTPLSLVATPAELDDGFVQVLGEYVNSHQTLSEQMENTKAILEAAKSESQKKATTAISNSSKTTKSKPSVSAAEIEEVEPGEDGEGDGEDAGQDETEAQSQTTATDTAANADSLWG